MNKDEIRSIIVSTLTSGSKYPGLFDLPKLLGLKSKLELCESIVEITVMLEDNRSLITKSFGLSNDVFYDL
jgi:hypothetical protein